MFASPACLLGRARGGPGTRDSREGFFLQLPLFKELRVIDEASLYDVSMKKKINKYMSTGFVSCARRNHSRCDVQRRAALLEKEQTHVKIPFRSSTLGAVADRPFFNIKAAFVNCAWARIALGLAVCKVQYPGCNSRRQQKPPVSPA